jgi:3-oxoacyl-[acyl-carrier protein] reductase
VAWVTGSSTGIGRAIALKLAREGCDVIVHYGKSEKQAREVEAQVQKLGREALLVQGDVSSADDVARMAREVGERFGRLDVLVNNAGSMVERATLEEMSEDLWDRIMGVNLKSVYLVSQAALPLLRQNGGGRIVNVTSIAAKDGGSTNALAYAAAKGGVSTMTKTMAKDLVSSNILVNAVSPGRIATPFHDRFSSPERRREMEKSIPIGREGTAEEVARAVAFLASDGADYVVGEVLEVNGGLLMF